MRRLRTCLASTDSGGRGSRKQVYAVCEEANCYAGPTTGLCRKRLDAVRVKAGESLSGTEDSLVLPSTQEARSLEQKSPDGAPKGDARDVRPVAGPTRIARMLTLRLSARHPPHLRGPPPVHPLCAQAFASG